MCVVVAYRAVHFGHDFDCGDFFARLHQTHHHVGNFLADGGRAGGLAMRAAEHGLVGKLVRHVAQL